MVAERKRWRLFGSFSFLPPFTFSLVFSPFILSGEGVVVVLGPTTTRYSRHIFFPSSFFSIHLFFDADMLGGEVGKKKKKTVENLDCRKVTTIHHDAAVIRLFSTD